MVWKPKEKDLSLEEALEQATNELLPFWFGSFPLLAGIEKEGTYVTVPLNQDLAKKNWLFFFIDFTDFSGDLALYYAKEWYKRYHAYKLEVLLVIVSPYRAFQTRELVQTILDENQVRIPCVIDAEMGITKSFGIESTPQMLLLRKGEVHLSYRNEGAIVGSEVELQNFLRTTDPGLPLLPLLKPNRAIVKTHHRMEFGYQPKLFNYAPFNPPGVVDQGNGLRMGKFHGVRPKKLEEGEIYISGDWIQDPEKIATSDLHASIAINCNVPFFSFVAQSLSKSIENPKVIVEIDGVPAYEAISGVHLTMDEIGHSVVRVVKPRCYQVLVNLPNKAQEIMLRFPNADAAPIGIYGIRLGQTVEFPQDKNAT